LGRLGLLGGVCERLDRIMLDTECLVELWVAVYRRVRSAPHMGHLERYVDVWIIPCFCLIESAEGRDFQVFFVAHVCELAAIAQLRLQKVVIAIELALNREVRLDASHFAQRLHVARLETFLVRLRRQVSQNVIVVAEGWTRHDSHVTLVTLIDNVCDLSDIPRQEAERGHLAQAKAH